MAALKWDEAGKKFYETGVSKVALYPYSGTAYSTGVAWNGVTGLTQRPSGADANKIYADNILYASLRSAEEFAFTVTAYTYPDEWMECDGSVSIEKIKGLTLGQQTRKTFGMSYRTEVGNDATEEAGYILHLVYGATASPSERAYKTKNDSPEAIEFSWECETVPVEVTGYRPVAHLQIDSRTADKAKLAELEKKLYGDETSGTASLPLPSEVMTILKSET